MANRAAYSASKAALANLGRAAAFEFGGNGITVNTLGATVIVTDLNRELVRTQPQLYDAIVRRTALGRLGEIDDLMGALLFLASPAANFVTGQLLFVDGGYTAG
jgi:NAD(P)-dependent dehydrogenase (short-subunit alcohol dehydrogenase family)